MKKSTYLLLTVLAALAAVGCNKNFGEIPGVQQGSGELTVSIGTAAPTKATSPTAGERTISSLQVFVFDNTGKLDISHAFTSAEISAMKATMTVKTGDKQVWAVANAAASKLSSVITVDQLKAVTVDLSENAPSKLIQVGSASQTLTTKGESVTLTLSRLVARVSLAKVKNSLIPAYGAIKVERVFLANVVGNQNLGGTAAPSLWYNKEGLKDESPLVAAHIIDGGSNAASCPSLTFAKPAATIAGDSSSAWGATDYLFYAFPNASTVKPAGFNATFSAQQTVLIVAVTISGTLYYYPVVLKNGLAANTEYAVSLDITGLGSSDPNKPIEKGALTATVTVSDWTTGSAVTETI